MSFSAISRRRSQDGDKIKIYSSPQFYKDSSGAYKEISTAAVDSSSSIGNIKLVSTTPFSVGTRTDGSLSKFIGFRPDENQSGSEQLEFTLSTVLIDGANVSINLAQGEVTDLYTDLGDVRILRHRNNCRQLIKVPDSGISKSFRVEYILNTRGLIVSEIDGCYLFSSEKGEYRFRIGKPCVMDSEYNILPVNVSHELSVESEGVYRYIKRVENFDFTQFDDVCYIDATTEHSDEDGAPYFISLFWSSCRGAGNGSSINSGSTNPDSTIECGSSLALPGFSSSRFIRRFFLSFDTSGISNCTSAFYADYLTTSTGFGVNKGVHTIVKGTFTGSVSFLDYDELDFNTPYASSAAVNSWGVGGYNGTALNNTAIADINSGSTFRVACIDYTHDFLNVDPGASAGTVSCRSNYFNEYTGTTRDPYIIVYTSIYGDMLSSSNF